MLALAACGSSVTGATTTSRAATSAPAAAAPMIAAAATTTSVPGPITRLFGWNGVTVTIDRNVAVSYNINMPLYGRPGERGVTQLSIEPRGRDTTIERFGDAPLDVLVAHLSGKVVGGSIVHGLGAASPHTVVAPQQPYLVVSAVFESVGFPSTGGAAAAPLQPGIYAVFAVLSRTATTARVAPIDRSLQVLAR
jgi:hypothetical protein